MNGISTTLAASAHGAIASTQAAVANAWWSVIQWPTCHHGLCSIGRQLASPSPSAAAPSLSRGGKSSRIVGIRVMITRKLTTTPAAEKIPNILIGTSSLTASVARPTAVVPVASESGRSAWCTARPAAPSCTPVSAS
jgi:hypothetical protein